MDHATSEQRIASMRDPETGKWSNPLHVATNVFRYGVTARLTRDPELKDDDCIVLLEVYLDTVLPTIHEFRGLLEVDAQGLWYYDGDGHIDDPVWRQYLLPWKHITGLILHQAT